MDTSCKTVQNNTNTQATTTTTGQSMLSSDNNNSRPKTSEMQSTIVTAPIVLSSSPSDSIVPTTVVVLGSSLSSTLAPASTGGGSGQDAANADESNDDDDDENKASDGVDDLKHFSSIIQDKVPSKCLNVTVDAAAAAAAAAVASRDTTEVTVSNVHNLISASDPATELVSDVFNCKSTQNDDDEKNKEEVIGAGAAEVQQLSSAEVQPTLSASNDRDSNKVLKQQQLVVDGLMLNDVDELQPLLQFSRENESRKMPPRGIVKSPSSKSFAACGDPTNNIDPSTTHPQSSGEPQPRPVLHVQFRGGCSNGSGGGGTANDGCSPPSSVTETSSSSSSSSGSSDDEDEGSSSGQYSEAQPPDGGWGWVVVFASFMVNLIADGITFSFGVIYVEFLNYFGEGKGKTAWIGSLFMAMPLLSGPVASFLTDRYGCRKVTIAGSILACLGFVISAFSTSMEMLFLTFGVLAGFGLSLCYVAAVVIVAYYFDKRRSFATGLSVCGSGIGTFIFAPLTQFLIEQYGWRGTTLILAGLFLNMTVCGMLMRDLEWTTHKHKLKAKQRKQRSRLGLSADSFSVSNSTNTGGTVAHDGGGGSGGEMGWSKVDATMNGRLFSSLITLPTFVKNGEKVSYIISILSCNLV